MTYNIADRFNYTLGKVLDGPAVGLNADSTLLDVYNAMPSNTIFVYHVGQESTTLFNQINNELGDGSDLYYGELIIIKSGSGNTGLFIYQQRITASTRNSMLYFKMYSTIADHGFDDKWKYINTTTVD